MMAMDNETLINRLGGTSRVAEMCHVTPGAVSQWRKNGIPGYRLMYLRLAKPDAFKEDRRKSAAQQVAA